jgi:hypothetical protein
VRAIALIVSAAMAAQAAELEPVPMGNRPSSPDGCPVRSGVRIVEAKSGACPKRRTWAERAKRRAKRQKKGKRP